MGASPHQLLHTPDTIAAFQKDLAGTPPMSAAEHERLQLIIKRISRNVELFSEETENELLATLLA
ncbi:hypothetical protein A3C37_05185 [Candidatus Peribacteria bacterium RIFCSPHIGHO2_02_FULL_53_20]|nr:MAG: hypothetical protein A3C37_05185 [Candidatus Peribacteria bacterium RIFCSPHIGHO2_02_FULL_53_20]OGJ65915.1 MAG: hypothetical protein A3B61_05270 [Candidatus Peribacteria bacterium RIFCSPLOWO2_01_FULL_53_10]OGJ75007.1 MAG: hypothetical protein A3G69_01275 [Candidatus Peribacteria bacterium RIFCSPLOWO2_12_FULL_53_10]